MDKIPTFSLILVTSITVVVSYFIAWYFRGDYTYIKMLWSYLAYLPLLGIVGFFLHLDLILIVGIYLFGAIILIFRDSTYFNR